MKSKWGVSPSAFEMLHLLRLHLENLKPQETNVKECLPSSEIIMGKGEKQEWNRSVSENVTVVVPEADEPEIAGPANDFAADFVEPLENPQ